MSAPTSRGQKPKPQPLLPVATESPSVFASADETASGPAPGAASPPSNAAGPLSQSAGADVSHGNGAATGAGAAAAGHAHGLLNPPPPQPLHWDPDDQTRGWEPLEHGRLRFALNRHFKNDEDEPNSSAFANALPEDLTSEAAHERELEDALTPTNDALLNVCDAMEPRVELQLQLSVINAINSAYTSSGYPSVMTAGNARGAVYGSFVDLRSSSTHTLNLPPRETILVAPSSSAMHGDSSKMETLMKVMWRRAANLMVSPPDLKKPAASGSATINAAAAVGLSRPNTLQQHIQQFPDGIHSKHSSPLLAQLLLRGEYPTTADEANAFPPVAPTPGAAGGAAAGSPTTAAANVPPPGKVPEGSAPVQHTLVSANTFNHLSVYFVAHQDGRFLYSAPVQTLSASIATRKVTAHHLFMMGREEVDPMEAVEGYELVFASAGSSSVPSSMPSTPSGLGSVGRKASSHASIGNSTSNNNSAAGPAAPTPSSPDCVDGKRQRLSFKPLSVPQAVASVLFDPNGIQFAGADARRRTIQAGLVGFQVEPLLMFGNQNGDIFIHSILAERVIQRLNFNGGSSAVNSSLCGAASSGSGNGKFVSSPVSCIVEVQNGLEKKLGSLAQNAILAKHNSRGSVVVDERVKVGVTPSGAVDHAVKYFPLSPSLFAVGFDSGEVLLLCVTTEGGWMLKHFGNSCFGYRPIQSIAPRIPPLFVRLWAGYAPAPAKASSAGNPSSRRGSSSKPSSASTSPKLMPEAVKEGKADSGAPTSTLICAASTLFVSDEEQHVAAMSCSGGCVVLVRLPGLEVLSSISVYDYSAVGEILTLAWSATSARTLLTPDILLASGEDDAMTAFHLVSTAVIPHATSCAMHNSSSLGTCGNAEVQTTNSTLSSNSSFHINSGLRILERKRFHRSWVSNMSVLPLVLPVSRAGPGMPQFLGTCLLATSYDNRTSFWPITFSGEQSSSSDVGVGGCGDVQDRAKYILIDGPTAAHPLHSEPVAATAVGGGGTSYFVASVCCRGRLRLWSCALKTE